MEDQEFYSEHEYSDPLVITDEIKAYLLETAKWGHFLSIIGFIGLGILLLMSVFITSIMSNMPSDAQGLAGLSGVGSGFLSMVYIIMASIYFFPTLYLYRFSTKVKSAVKNNDQEEMTYGLEHLKRTFKFIGIFTAIIFGFYMIMFVLSLLLGIFGALAG